MSLYMWINIAPSMGYCITSNFGSLRIYGFYPKRIAIKRYREEFHAKGKHIILFDETK